MQPRRYYRTSGTTSTSAKDQSIWELDISIMNIGRFAHPTGLYCPDDLTASFETFGANCGPAAFAALTRTSVSAAMAYFPHYPRRRWCTIGDMRSALRGAVIEFDDTQGMLPACGVALIQIEGKSKHPMALLSNTHWIAIRYGCVYDINWRGWLPLATWEQVVFHAIAGNRARRAAGWSVYRGLHLHLNGTQLDCPHQGVGHLTFREMHQKAAIRQATLASPGREQAAAGDVVKLTHSDTTSGRMLASED